MLIKKGIIYITGGSLTAKAAELVAHLVHKHGYTYEVCDRLPITPYPFRG